MKIVMIFLCECVCVGVRVCGCAWNELRKQARAEREGALRLSRKITFNIPKWRTAAGGPAVTPRPARAFEMVPAGGRAPLRQDQQQVVRHRPQRAPQEQEDGKKKQCVRWHGDGLQVGRGRVLARHHLGVDVAVQLVVEVVVAHVLQGGAAGGALEALDVQVLVLDAHEDTPATKTGRPLQSRASPAAGE